MEEISYNIIQRINWQCIHENTIEKQIGWMQKKLKDMDKAGF
jgi:hypothetical protein